jgi:hypothetical protein
MSFSAAGTATFDASWASALSYAGHTPPGGLVFASNAGEAAAKVDTGIWSSAAIIGRVQ